MANVLVGKCVSAFGHLNKADRLKGLLVAVATVVLDGVVQALNAGAMPTAAQLKTAAIAGLSAGGVYIIKQWLTGPPKGTPDAIVIPPTADLPTTTQP